jgi:CspA family cold shock protein
MTTTMDDASKLRGTIIAWFDVKGYGWVTRDDGEPDIFLHVSDVAGDFEPQKDDRISFTIGADRKGRPSAVKATILEAKDGEPTTPC